MKQSSFGLIALILGSLFILSCSNGEPMQENKPYMQIIDSISEQQWKQLSRKNIYFGHQSVGFNIMDGVTDIMADNDEIDFTIKETSDRSDFDEPVFAHSRNGENRDWLSKIKGFHDKIENGIGKNADIVLFKFCYLDIVEDTDVAMMFQSYKDVMQKLQDKFPSTTFIYTTTPLRRVSTGWKAWIKGLIGRDRGYAENIKRNEYNEMIRQEYKNTGKLFDIARAESTLPDGSQQSFKEDGNEYASLVPAYTYDGGHLNETGRKIVAAHFLETLAGQVE